MWLFFDRAASNENPLLGSMVGKRDGYSRLGQNLSQRLESAPTLLQSLQELTRLVALEASDLQLGLKKRKDDILLCTQYPGRRMAPGYAVSQTYQLSAYLQLIQFFLGRRWQPKEVGLELPEVPRGLEEYFPEARLLAQQPCGYIAVPTDCLYRKVNSTVSVDLAPGEATDPEKTDRDDYVKRLRGLLQAYLPDGYASQSLAAELMGTSVRTLTRRLSCQGLTYGTLIDDLRVQMVVELLRGSDLPLRYVAQAVGFEDQGDFTRMFRRVSGLTPGRFRRSKMH
jgi:AraC-like DNA-binding protein